MKLAPGCYECLRRLICQAAELATGDASLKQRAIKEAMKILDDEFSCSQLSIVIATKIHKVVKEVTHNPDPYRGMKEKEMDVVAEFYKRIIIDGDPVEKVKADIIMYKAQNPDIHYCFPME